MAESTNGNGIVVGIEVLAERIANIAKKLDEQIALSKMAVDAALTAIQVAKSDQERTVSVAFAASQSAITKTEESQKESNRAINNLQQDVVSLKVSSSMSSGTGKGMRDMWGYIFGFIMTIVTVYMALHK